MISVKCQKIISVMLTLCIVLIIAGCGGPKKVSDLNITLDLSYGSRSGTYTGEVNDQNLPNGKGKFTTKNNDGKTWIYEGEFKNGHFEGKGKQTWPELGQVKEGTYTNDLLTGQGKITVANKPEKNYEGNFVAGAPMLDSVGMNEPVSYADWEYSATKVETQNSAGNRQANGKYVIVYINDKNNGNSTRKPADDNFFLLFNKTNGTTYKMDMDASLALRLTEKQWQQPWNLSDVNPGNSVSNIKIVFDVPADIDINNLYFLPRKAFGKAAPIQLQQ